jgi:hypothetical protein
MDNPEIYGSGNKRWLLNGQMHRTDGPAIVWAGGDVEWYLYGERHRTDGPAVEFIDGELWWCLNDKCYTFDEWLELNPDLAHEQKVMMKLQYG